MGRKLSAAALAFCGEHLGKESSRTPSEPRTQTHSHSVSGWESTGADGTGPSGPIVLG